MKPKQTSQTTQLWVQTLRKRITDKFPNFASSYNNGSLRGREKEKNYVTDTPCRSLPEYSNYKLIDPIYDSIKCLSEGNFGWWKKEKKKQTLLSDLLIIEAITCKLISAPKVGLQWNKLGHVHLVLKLPCDLETRVS